MIPVESTNSDPARFAQLIKGSTHWRLNQSQQIPIHSIAQLVLESTKLSGAEHIYAIDINEKKFEYAKQFGATHCINPTDNDKPIQ